MEEVRRIGPERVLRDAQPAECAFVDERHRLPRAWAPVRAAIAVHEHGLVEERDAASEEREPYRADTGGAATRARVPSQRDVAHGSPRRYVARLLDGRPRVPPKVGVVSDDGPGRDDGSDG